MYGSGSLGEKGVEVNGHPAWLPPQRLSDQPVLRIHNSLTGAHDEFIPLRNRQIRWYTCGPTVYDSAHVGHARSYVTFDIHRRILMDYFNYDVLYQINITDIDDKIILRARQNKLVEDFTKECQSRSFEEVMDVVNAAVEEQGQKLKKKRVELSEPLPSSANSRKRDEREDQLKQLSLKEENFEKMVAQVSAATQKKDVSAVLTAAKDAIAGKLDKEKGHTVRDLSVFDQHSRRFEREFLEDMEALGVRHADVLTRVTEYVPKIVDFIVGIINKDMAYESNGSVYLDIERFKKSGHDYRKLDPSKGDTSQAELEESEGALGSTDAKEKRNPNDFALWKKSKPGEPEWDSPWGRGRPGWHIECSVVASDILGNNLDMHSGGEDLKFPHHDNELAQSEAFCDTKQWVNYFTHAGHLHIKGLKMSKSLKNFITIRQALEHHSARQLRLLFLLQDWDKPMNFSDQTVDDAKSKESTLKNFFQKVKSILREDWLGESVGFRMPEKDQDLVAEFLQTQQTVHESLLNNLETKSAMLAMIKLVSKANLYLQTPNCQPAVLTLRSIAVYITKMLAIFGVIPDTFDSIGFPTQGSSSGDLDTVVKPYMDAFSSFREKIRSLALGLPKDNTAKSTLLDLCDSVRDSDLVEIGVRLEDLPSKQSIWKLDDPAVLKAEMAEKEQQKRELEAQQQRRKVEKLQKTLFACEPLVSKSPANFFDKTKYVLSEDGTPVSEVGAAEPLAKSKVKKLKKEKLAYEKLYAKMLKESDGDLSRYVEEIKQQIAALSLAKE